MIDIFFLYYFKLFFSLILYIISQILNTLLLLIRLSFYIFIFSVFILFCSCYCRKTSFMLRELYFIDISYVYIRIRINLIYMVDYIST